MERPNGPLTPALSPSEGERETGGRMRGRSEVSLGSNVILCQNVATFRRNECKRMETLNVPVTPSLAPSEGERVAGGRVRGHSEATLVTKDVALRIRENVHFSLNCIGTMNRSADSHVREFLRFGSRRHGCPRSEQRFMERKAGRSAFTLLELLIVMGIIAILAAIALPALKGLGKTNLMESAVRQLLDDLSLAQQMAVNRQTVVHVVFVPPNVNSMSFNSSDPRDVKTANNLMDRPYRGYALFAERTVGDQPGRPRFHYLTPWRTMPDGVIIAVNEFNAVPPNQWGGIPNDARPFQYVPLPFPTTYGLTNLVPHVAFDAHGSLLVYDAKGNRLFKNEFIDLKQASVLTQRDANGNVMFYDVKETTPPNQTNNYTRIVIDAFSGRARVDRPQIQ
jgi:prepilin-type N-terminal cleavage/methylation domain-containing protein